MFSGLVVSCIINTNNTGWKQVRLKPLMVEYRQHMFYFTLAIPLSAEIVTFSTRLSV